MEKEEAWFNDLSKERAAFEFFWQQTSSLHQLDTSGETNESERRLPQKTTKKVNTQKETSNDFMGEKDSLVFAAPLSLKKHYGQGMILAQYKIVYNVNGKYDLIYLETPLNSTIKKTWAEEFENTFILENCTSAISGVILSIPIFTAWSTSSFASNVPNPFFWYSLATTTLISPICLDHP